MGIFWFTRLKRTCNIYKYVWSFALFKVCLKWLSELHLLCAEHKLSKSMIYHFIRIPFLNEYAHTSKIIYANFMHKDSLSPSLSCGSHRFYAKRSVSCLRWEKKNTVANHFLVGVFMLIPLCSGSCLRITKLSETKIVYFILLLGYNNR